MIDKPLSVGIIGTGLIAQTRHMQLLRELDAVRVEAVCDIAPDVAQAVRQRFHIPDSYTDYRELLSRDDIEAVAIFTYDHAEIVLDAIQAGKHVLVEKPLAFTPTEGRQIVEAAARKNVIVMVAYMKVYDPGFQWAAKRVAEQGQLRSIYVLDAGGAFASLHRKDVKTLRGSGTPTKGKKWSQEVLDRAGAALGESHAHLAENLVVLMMLGTHDLGILCEAFGPPTGVSYARAIGPNRMVAILDYPHGVPCFFDVGVGSGYQWWEEHITSYGHDDIVRVEFGNPFLPFAQTTVTIKEGHDGRRSQVTAAVDYDDAFRLEWVAFAEAIRTQVPPKTSAVEGLRDIEICVEIIKAIKT
jgi:predicted dehydrogenase